MIKETERNKAPLVKGGGRANEVSPRGDYARTADKESEVKPPLLKGGTGERSEPKGGLRKDGRLRRSGRQNSRKKISFVISLKRFSF